MTLLDLDRSSVSSPNSGPVTYAVRDGRMAPVVCQGCGCRLEAPPPWFDDDGDGAGGWRHFPGENGRDARGCRVDCIDRNHRADGTIVI